MFKWNATCDDQPIKKQTSAQFKGINKIGIDTNGKQ